MNLEKLLEEVQWRQVPDKAVSIYHKYAEVFEREWEKQGQSPFLHNLAEYMNIKPGHFPGGIPNSPSPLASMLVGGLAGAGLGYGLGYVGENVLPNNWERGKLRRTLALIGGGAGALPGTLWGTANLAGGDSFNNTGMFQESTGELPPVNYDVAHLFENVPTEIGKEVRSSWEKAAERYPGAGLLGAPIDVDEFNFNIWHDPRVAGPLEPREQAAASGLITAAANLPGKANTQFVTPMDVARMAAGMGSGYLSGMLVGKALGTLMGMPPKTQDTLKNTGMWAGMVANLVPMVFGR